MTARDIYTIYIYRFFFVKNRDSFCVVLEGLNKAEYRVCMEYSASLY